MPGRQRDDQIAMTNVADALAVTIRPPFGERANAAMARSISPASRTLIGLTSTLSDGATAWMTPNWPVPEARAGSRRTATRVTPGAICLSSSSHFPLCRIHTHETGGVAARPRKALDETGADRIAGAGNTIGTVRVACSNGPTVEAPEARMTSGASATNSAACLRISAALAAAQRVSIRTLRPMFQPDSSSPCRNAPRRAEIQHRPRPQA